MGRRRLIANRPRDSSCFKWSCCFDIRLTSCKRRWKSVNFPYAFFDIPEAHCGFEYILCHTMCQTVVYTTTNANSIASPPQSWVYITARKKNLPANDWSGWLNWSVWYKTENCTSGTQNQKTKKKKNSRAWDAISRLTFTTAVVDLTALHFQCRSFDDVVVVHLNFNANKSKNKPFIINVIWVEERKESCTPHLDPRLFRNGLKILWHE